MSAGTCERCGTARAHIHRHHIKPRSEGGTDEDGIELLCANCHEDEHGSPYGYTFRAAKRRADREAAIPEEELRRLYEEEKLSIRQIAARLRTAPSNVQFWLVDYDIDRRESKLARGAQRPSKEELRSALIRLGSQAAVAAEYGVTRPAVSLWCKNYGLVGIVDGRKTSPPAE